MTANEKPGVLFILDSPPEGTPSINFYSTYISNLASEMSGYMKVSLFYPVFSTTEEYYTIRTDKSDEEITRYFFHIPQRYKRFIDTYSNSDAEAAFEEIIKGGIYDFIHIFSLKNHSFNYPFIARKYNIPVLISIYDNHLRCPLLFCSEAECHSEEKCRTCVKISNFVASPFYSAAKKIEELFTGRRKNYNWFEQVGRYSSFYNRDGLTPIDESSITERVKLRDEVFGMADRFHFFSEITYNSLYRHFIPENKVVFIEQGIYPELVLDTRPFDIDGSVTFGYIADIIPEEGIEELLAAFNIIYDRGFHSALHIYGEIYKNRDYVTRLKKNLRNPNVIFHGAIEPERLSSTLETFDILIVPSKWERSDLLLLSTAIAKRKAVIAYGRNIIGETIRKTGRGIPLAKVDPTEIADAAIELELNRKKLFYTMRMIDDYRFNDIRDNVQEFISVYISMTRKTTVTDEFLQSSKKLLRKRVSRLRGTA